MNALVENRIRKSKVIGTFRRGKDGGWIGDIRTPGFSQKVRLVPNDDRKHPNAPAFRLTIGWISIGDAWEARSRGNPPKDYLRVEIDGPLCPTPIMAAMFPNADGLAAQLLWRRSTDNHGSETDDD